MADVELKSVALINDRDEMLAVTTDKVAVLIVNQCSLVPGLARETAVQPFFVLFIHIRCIETAIICDY